MLGFGHYGMGWGMILGWFFPLLLLVLLGLYFVRGQGDKPKRTALDILEERYARGEIDRDEFLKRRDDLMQ
ncbi:SHOCT domain-containing protein [Thiobacillus denitrificans]|jgi:putative membrane protein|uniref:SHOCT domain-containing protein n=1 Tax=Thiobacillus denitrificans TaxID=36861 RepID=UPI00037F0241|nr:SHOCT domain-containing protein [Thiobacillus denitrificans]